MSRLMGRDPYLVLVTGANGIERPAAVFQRLEKVRAKAGDRPLVIIHGGGSIRNHLMLNLFSFDEVIAFTRPLTDRTQDMIQRAEAAGYQVDIVPLTHP